MLGSVKKNPERLQAVDRVIGWTRERFALPKDLAVSVSEIACPLPGCPPLETVVAFWIADQRHRFRVFKPLERVVAGDLPPAWFKDALAAPEGAEWDCC
jgi:nitrate reductase delta subunit